MEKKLFYQLSDNADLSFVVMDLSGAMEWIKSDMENVTESDDQREFTLIPIWLTDEEFDNLHEAEL